MDKQETKNLLVDEPIAEIIAEGIDWMEVSTSIDKSQEAVIGGIKDWIHENFHDIAADHWYFSKCEDCKSKR